MEDAMVSGSASEGAQDRARDVADGPGLPYAKAFVVQFTAETDAGLEHAGGRVEHLQSGRRARFASIGDLRACIVSLLADGSAKPAGPRKGGGRRRTGPGSGTEPPSP